MTFHYNESNVLGVLPYQQFNNVQDVTTTRSGIILYNVAR